jgi:hypothetical protein
MGQAIPGALVAEQCMVLKAQTLPFVSELISSGSLGPEAELPTLAAALMAGGLAVCAVEAGPGRVRLEGARALDYADRFLHYFHWHVSGKGGEKEESQTISFSLPHPHTHACTFRTHPQPLSLFSLPHPYLCRCNPSPNTKRRRARARGGRAMGSPPPPSTAGMPRC